MFRFHSHDSDGGPQESPLFGGGSRPNNGRRSQRSGGSGSSSSSNSGGSGSSGGRRGGFPFGFGGGRRSKPSGGTRGNGGPPRGGRRSVPVNPFDDEHNLIILADLTLGQQQAALLKKVKDMVAAGKLDPQSYRVNQVKILQSQLKFLDYDALHEAAKNMDASEIHEGVEGVEVDEDGELFIDVQSLRDTLIGWVKRGQFAKLTVALKKAPKSADELSRSSSSDAEMKQAPSASSNYRAQSKSAPAPAAAKSSSPDSENDQTMRDIISYLDPTEPDCVYASTSATSRTLERTLHEFLKKQREARFQMLNAKFIEECASDVALLSFAQSLRVDIRRFDLDASEDKVTVPARMTSLNTSADVDFLASIFFVGGKSFNCTVSMTTQENVNKPIDVYASLFELEAPSKSSSALNAGESPRPTVSQSPTTEKVIAMPELVGALDVGGDELPDSLLRDVLRAYCRVCVVNLF